jgi:Fe-S-cluster-containing hydrogenase component 2
MAKALVVDHEKCDGCRRCESACSLKHTGAVNPAPSRIRIDEWERHGVFVPVVCHQCEDAPCIAACPTNSRRRDEATGKTDVDYRRCISCKTCIAVCPFGATSFDPVSKQVITCDLCDGEPQCVKVCETGALSYIDKADIYRKRQVEAASKLFRSTDRGVLVRSART